MRFARLCFASVLLLPFAASSVCPQQQAPAGNAAAESAPVADTHSVASVKNEDAIVRGQAKAAERGQKDKEKADAKAKREQEKQRKEAEKDATYLKLQDNEIVASTFDKDGNPVKLAPCARKDKACQEKRKELLKQKKLALNVENGTLTVDGWTGKARLNYDVKNFQYIYISMPGYGTLIASPYHFPGSVEYKDGIDGKTLTIETDDKHTVQLTSDQVIVGKQKRSVFYAVDRHYTQPGSFPTMGYGFVKEAPYVWPGALPLTEEQKRLMAKAPPLPQGMELREMTLPCQKVSAGEALKPIKVNGVLVTPPACKAKETPGAYTVSERAPDGSGAASTGVADSHRRP